MTAFAQCGAGPGLAEPTGQMRKHSPVCNFAGEPGTRFRLLRSNQESWPAVAPGDIYNNSAPENV
jgi:hypothetical protein